LNEVILTKRSKIDVFSLLYLRSSYDEEPLFCKRNGKEFLPRNPSSPHSCRWGVYRLVMGISQSSVLKTFTERMAWMYIHILVVVIIALLSFLIFICRSNVLHATQLKNGMWFVYWSTYASYYSTTNVQCGVTSLQLVSSVGGDKTTLSIKGIQGVTSLLIFDDICHLFKNCFHEAFVILAHRPSSSTGRMQFGG